MGGGGGQGGWSASSWQVGAANRLDGSSRRVVAGLRHLQRAAGAGVREVIKGELVFVADDARIRVAGHLAGDCQQVGLFAHVGRGMRHRRFLLERFPVLLDLLGDGFRQLFERLLVDAANAGQ